MTLKQWIADKPKRKRAKFLNLWLPLYSCSAGFIVCLLFFLFGWVAQ